MRAKLSVAHIFRDSVLELLLTSCLLFGVVSIVRWVIGPSPISRSVPQIQSELLIVGVGVGILLTALILSPAGMAVIVLLVGICLGTPRVAPLIPYIVGGAIGLAIVLLGTSTGGSVNPARQFGPAVISGETRFLWVYLLAPMAGAMLATWLWQLQRLPKLQIADNACLRRVPLG
jgi:glycerol uptake facilitator-like aquaporin